MLWGVLLRSVCLAVSMGEVRIAFGSSSGKILTLSSPASPTCGAELAVFF